MGCEHKGRLLIIDDEVDMLEGLSRLLSYEIPSLAVEACAHPKKAVGLAQRAVFDVVLVDIRMPEMDGLEVLKALREIDPWQTVVMMTAYGSIELAVQAIKAGAYDFVTKPFDKDALLRILHKAMERNRLIRQNLRLQRQVKEQSALESLVGRSLPMQRLHEQIQTVARSDYSVLIRGQSGTGKELVAKALYGLSKRAERAFITVNCPAIPEHLLESELFGHRKGAFTGADRDQPGLFSEAHGGTLFLDEIGDIPLATQTKLLRVLQEQEIKPLGATQTRQVDVRVLASTNQDLERKMAERSFREDLYYRLNGVTIWTPALADMAEDIPLLAGHFVTLACDELGLAMKSLSLEALELLVARKWPGNVRELQNFMRQAVMFCPHQVIRPEDLKFIRNRSLRASGCERGEAPSQPDSLEPYKEAKQRALARFTQHYVDQLLSTTGGNVTRAAEVSGLTRAALQKIMKRMGVHSSAYRNDGP